METSSERTSPGAAVKLYWIPLGAGGNGFVRRSGQLYETVKARFEHRRSMDLYHTALEVYVGGDRFVVEDAWPSPDAETESRGVVVEGPLFSRRLARFRAFRYEVRCWRNGLIADSDEAVAVAVLTRDSKKAQLLLDHVARLPPLTWGRDERDTGDMWNSNSVVAWLLAKSGVRSDAIHPPPGGRAPGWIAGIRAGDDTGGLEGATQPYGTTRRRVR